MNNVLIIGNNGINASLEQRFRSEGFSVDIISDSRNVTRLKGKPGAYVLTTSEKKYTGFGVIITENPYTENAELFNAKALNLLDSGTIQKLKSLKGRKKIVFLLDYCEETPEQLTTEALEAAALLSDAKKDVYFLSVFVKAASAGMEKLFLKARLSGVTFIRYEQVSPEWKEEAGLFAVKAYDGVFDTVIETPYLVTVGNRDDSILAFLSHKFRLSRKNEMVSEFKYFLNPALTMRKGVFHINDKNLDDSLPFIIDELKQIAACTPSVSHAEIDAGKCAFCYTCYRACPHAALEPDLEANAMICVESACMACGICAAICPGEAIVMTGETPGLTFDTAAKGGTKEDGSAKRTARSESDEASASPTVCKVFCCENSAAPAFMEIERELGTDVSRLSLTEIPCGGRLGREVITAALASYGKVLVAVCMDDACRHMNGGERACKQTERVILSLQKSGLSEKKVQCVKVSHAMPMILMENVRAFLEDYIEEN